MKKKMDNKRWMYLLGFLVFLGGLTILWFLSGNKKECNCKDSGSNVTGKGGNTSKGGGTSTGGTSDQTNNDNVGLTVEELKDLLLTKGNSECGC